MQIEPEREMELNRAMQIEPERESELDRALQIEPGARVSSKSLSSWVDRGPSKAKSSQNARVSSIEQAARSFVTLQGQPDDLGNIDLDFLYYILSKSKLPNEAG